MRKILIIGNADSIWVKNYIEHILMSDDYEVYLTTTSLKTRFDIFYQQRHVFLVPLQRRASLLDKIPKLNGIANILTRVKSLKKYGFFDVIHVHYVTRAALLLAKLLKQSNTRIVVSYWGSDLLRKGARELKKESKFFSEISCFTLSSDAMYEKFIKVYSHKYSERINKVRFGVSGFLSIMHVKETLSIEDCKKSIGADPQKVLIAIGYNKAQGQQHDKVLSQIQTLDKSLQERIELVLQCGYGECSEEYWERLQQIISTLSCKTIILTNYMSDIDVAKLRYAVDIYINAQITDAFSATMQEYLFSGAMVLNPIWLSYPEISEFGLSCVEYKDISEIPEVVAKIISAGVYRQLENAAIYQYSSWENLKKGWEKGYFFPIV